LHYKFFKLIIISLFLIPLFHTNINLSRENNKIDLEIKNAINEKSNIELSELTKNFTIILDGPTEGTGVIVSKEGKRYRVLTSWHVVKESNINDEVIVITSDGKKHIWDPKSILKIKNLDLATFTFKSTDNYRIALIGDSSKVKEGEKVFVGGYPIGNESYSNRIFRFQSGYIRANAKIYIENGYQLLYSNRTVKGMSGGPVLNKKGKLIGIHGRAEIDKELSLDQGKLIATGTNKAIPISYYKEFINGKRSDLTKYNPTTKDDYLAQVSSLFGENGREKDIINLSKKALEIEEDPLAYFYIGLAKYFLKDLNKSLDSFSKSIKLDPYNASSFYNRALIKSDLKDFKGASKDYKKAIELSPKGKIQSTEIPPIIKNLKNKSENLNLNKDDLKKLRNIITMTIFDKLSGIKESRDSSLELIQKSNNEIKDVLPEAMNEFSRFLESDKIEKDLNKLFQIISNTSSLNEEKSFYKEKETQKNIDKNSQYFFKAGNLNFEDKQFKKAIFNYSNAIRINPEGGRNGVIFYSRGEAKLAIGDLKGACLDYKKAISKGNKKSKRYLNSRDGNWCKRIK
tara:strand:- start:484 stop:2196 length:1713 start_codon:yes stop_codon:yes gene_type:complete